MNIIRSTRAGLAIEGIKGPLIKIGDKKNLFKLKYYYFKVENDSSKAFGQECSNSLVIYRPLVCVVTDDGATELINHTYGTSPLGDCEFVYFNKVKGKMIPVTILKITNCLSRFAMEIDKSVFDKLKTSKIESALASDEGLSFPKNFAEYIENTVNAQDIDLEENLQQSSDSSRYVILILYYDGIELKCTEINLDGVIKGNTATKIECWER